MLFFHWISSPFYFYSWNDNRKTLYRLLRWFFKMERRLLIIFYPCNNTGKYIWNKNFKKYHLIHLTNWQKKYPYMHVYFYDQNYSLSKLCKLQSVKLLDSWRFTVYTFIVAFTVKSKPRQPCQSGGCWDADTLSQSL